ncbi:hypothetical protein DASC09_018200 [Saccharomycopsis crataegensis]|uniref:Uncharacterized protein n=1 Tax=Saccharomycopsis crataegensis TaxID=43959 RepID=A0AAV5QHS9_9ASCO|nr:hypothetical protein DASC09_018200 [Saccharomycopsis crataegensis]
MARTKNKTTKNTRKPIPIARRRQKHIQGKINPKVSTVDRGGSQEAEWVSEEMESSGIYNDDTDNNINNNSVRSPSAPLVFTKRMKNGPLLPSKPSSKAKAISKSSQAAEDASLINKAALNDLKLQTIKKRILTRTAQKRWEELSPGSFEEIMKLLLLSVEPSLRLMKSQKQKKEGRRILNKLIKESRAELDGILVPIGFKDQNFNFDYLVKRVSYLQKTYSQNLEQVSELERTLAKERIIYKNNKNYLEKLQKTYRSEEKAFAHTEKNMLRSLKTNDIANMNSDPENSKFVNDYVTNSSDGINLKLSAGSLAPLDLSTDVQELLSSVIPPSFSKSFGNIKNYDPNEDEDIAPLLAQLSKNLKQLDQNVVALKDLSGVINKTDSLLN